MSITKREVVVTERNGVRTFDLGIIVTDYGVKSDSNRVKTMVGSIPSGLNPNVPFTRIDEWPEGIVKLEGKKLLVVQYMGQSFRDFSARNERLRNDGYPFMGFADLCAVLKTDDLLVELPKILWKHGVYWLEVPDELSLRRIGDHVYAPDFYCVPDYHRLLSLWVDSGRVGGCAALVGEQVSK